MPPAPPSNYHASLAIQGSKVAGTARALLTTLSAAVRSGDFEMKGSEDMSAFVTKALEDLNREVNVFDLLADARVKGRR